jgi:hypothetical protein
MTQRGRSIWQGRTFRKAVLDQELGIRYSDPAERSAFMRLLYRLNRARGYLFVFHTADELRVYLDSQRN